jgi:gamma-glutamylputrescine oxidase
VSEYAWSGTLGHTVHSMPQIGQLSSGLWLASGFGGHGLNTTALAGLLIARGMVDGDPTWKQFSAFELVWAGGIVGRVTAQAYYWAMRLQQAMAERRARAAETARRRTRTADDNAPDLPAPPVPADANFQSDHSEPAPSPAQSAELPPSA